jgi:hypothetical protein
LPLIAYSRIHLIPGQKTTFAPRCYIFHDMCQPLPNRSQVPRARPLARPTGQPFALPKIAALKNLHLIARVGRAEAQIAAGQHREMVGELQALVTQYPYHGEIHALLIHSLNRSQRPVEAAEAARDAVRAALEGGIDDRAMIRLQQDLLRGSLPMTGPLAA